MITQESVLMMLVLMICIINILEHVDRRRSIKNIGDFFVRLGYSDTSELKAPISGLVTWSVLGTVSLFLFVWTLILGV